MMPDCNKLLRALLNRVRRKSRQREGIVRWFRWNKKLKKTSPVLEGRLAANFNTESKRVKIRHTGKKIHCTHGRKVFWELVIEGPGRDAVKCDRGVQLVGCGA